MQQLIDRGGRERRGEGRQRLRRGRVPALAPRHEHEQELGLHAPLHLSQAQARAAVCAEQAEGGLLDRLEALVALGVIAERAAEHRKQQRRAHHRQRAAQALGCLG